MFWICIHRSRTIWHSHKMYIRYWRFRKIENDASVIPRLVVTPCLRVTPRSSETGISVKICLSVMWWSSVSQASAKQGLVRPRDIYQLEVANQLFTWCPADINNKWWTSRGTAAQPFAVTPVRSSSYCCHWKELLPPDTCFREWRRVTKMGLITWCEEEIEKLSSVPDYH